MMLDALLWIKTRRSEPESACDERALP